VGYKAAQKVALTVTGKLKKTPARNELEMLGDFLGGFGGGNYWVDFKVDQVGPVCDPVVDEGSVVRFHELVAAGEIFIDPAGDVEEAFGGHPALVAEAAVDGGGSLFLKCSMIMYWGMETSVRARWGE
jgi:hypothetical protein